jgi:hypothetical protein
MSGRHRSSLDDLRNPNRSSEVGDMLHTKQGTDFELEHYKYILQQIHTLNDNIHKYLALFQTLATAIIGGGIWLFVSWRNLNIHADVVRASIQGLIGLLIILTLFVIISIGGGIFSWLDYRREEVELLNDVVRPGFRKMPTLRNFWRWYETYVIVFIITFVLVISIYVESQILPLIK